MEVCQVLIAALRSGDYISGEELGERLGVSRAAVWKQVARLREAGIPIEACQRRGYRIAGGLALLDPEAIRRPLGEAALAYLSEMETLLIVESTNDEAMARSKRGGASGYVCLAECQTAGKGRRGRTWISPFASNIYLSTVRRFEGGAAAVEGLSLAVGVALVRSLAALGFRDLRLKWPNDILWRGRKLGGVLLEIAGDPAGLCDVIVGVGVNTNMPIEDAERIDQAWVDLQQVGGVSVDRNQVAGTLLNGLLPLLAGYERVGFKSYQLEWQELDAFHGRNVVLRAGSQVYSGRSRGVTESGALLMELPDGLRSFSGGEISLRALR